MSDREHVVYRFFDSAGALLYVGCTNNFHRRRGQHAASKPWWSDVDEARTTFDRYPEKWVARAAETEAINTEGPRHNLPTGRPRGLISPSQLQKLLALKRAAEDAEKAHRRVVVGMMAEGASFGAVSKFTGLSTSTLQRWKRESNA